MGSIIKVGICGLRMMQKDNKILAYIIRTINLDEVKIVESSRTIDQKRD